MNFIFLLFLLLTAGCSTVPPTNVHQPMTARPSPRFDMPNGNGAIYQAANSRPLFEDRRARYVGDTITVKITVSILMRKAPMPSVAKVRQPTIISLTAT